MFAETLPPAFTLKDAREAEISKSQIYSLLEKQKIERIGRGVFVQHETLDPELISLAAATSLQKDATLCLTSALVHHDLSDAIPFAVDIALPRGVHHPSGFAHVNWRSFNATTFQIGREFVDAGNGFIVGIYSAERTIIDSFRLMHQEGNDIAYEALRRWLRKRGNAPTGLLKIATSFPRIAPKIRHALEVLL